MRTQPKFPSPQPVPTTPIRGTGIVRCDFNSATLRALAKRLKTKLNSKWAIIKPKRNSVGVIWNNQVFWWSTKGFYRTGKIGQKRRCFHHVLWEHYHGRPMPAGHEIFFMDRDYHNFSKRNLVLMSKAEVLKRTHELGETRLVSDEQRRQMVLTRWTRFEKKAVGCLLDRFNRGDRVVTGTLHRDRYDQRIARAERRATQP